jgi:hemoglobin
MATIYDKLGGYRNIEKIVAQFYQTILNDEGINVFYLENVSDIAQLHTSVAQFFSFIFGGPNLYKGKNMKEAHKHMPISMADYDKVWTHMRKAFEAYGVKEDIINEIKTVIYSFTSDIINKK